MTSKQYNKQIKGLESKFNAGKISEEDYGEASQNLEMRRLMSLENELDIDWIDDDPTEWFKFE